MNRLVAVWDVDGTLANHDHRAALLYKRCTVCLHHPMPVQHHSPCPTCGNTSSSITQQSWDDFLDPELMSQDKPILAALKVLEKLRDMNAEIHFITGRAKDVSFEVTAEWLLFKVERRPGELLFMREEEDRGLPASKYKAKAIERLKGEIGSEGVFMFFEDDPHVFPVYNKHGIVVRCPQGLEHFMPPGLFRAEEAWRI